MQITEGELFGRLTAIREISDGTSVRKIECRCDCGAIKNVKIYNLKSGATKSCGCTLSGKPRVKRAPSHGMTGTRTYRIWTMMLTRVRNPNIKYAHNYIERGITVCDSWLKFENFYADMGDAPDDRSLDRIDNEGNYCKENCKWSTKSEQGRNLQRSGQKQLGVSQNAIGKWTAKITTNTVRTHLGTFSTYEEAVTARKAAEALYWK